METIRNVRIVVNLETGKVDLKAPNLDATIKATEQQVKLTQDLIREQQKLASLQSTTAGGGAGSSGGSGGSSQVSSLEQVLRLEKQIADERAKFMAGGGLDAFDRMAAAQDKLAESQERLRQSAGRYYRQAFEGANQAGEGFFRLARATVLLGASGDESFQKMIRGLALVQAGFDLFRGTTQIVLGLQKAMQALATAQALEAAAAGGSATAHVAQAGAMGLATVAARGLAAAGTLVAAVFSPITIILVALAAVIYAVVKAWDAFTVSETEAKEAADKQREAVEKQIAVMEKLLGFERAINEARRRGLSDQAQLASLMGEGRSQSSRAAEDNRRARFNGSGASAVVEAGLREAQQAEATYAKAETIAKGIRDAAIEEREAKIKSIEAQEKLVEAAKKQFDIEQQKVRVFQAQFGMLSQFEQQQLISIRNKLRAGQGISTFEEDFISDKGGEQGSAVANALRAKRGAAAGADENFWSGIDGATNGMKDASSELAKAVKEMADLLKEIGKGATATEAKAQLEAEIKEMQNIYEASIAEIRKAAEANLQVMKDLYKQLIELQTAVQQGG